MTKERSLTTQTSKKPVKLLGANIRQDSLVIITSTVGVGVIEGLIRETLENTSGFRIGAEIGLAYSPIRNPNMKASEKELAQEQIVAATDKTSLNAASTVLETISQGTLKKTLSVGAAETAALFEAAQREVKSALANEFAVFCEKAGVDYSGGAKTQNSRVGHFLFTRALRRKD